MATLLDRRVLFFGGKGGVGKTTCSSALALAASRQGRRVLLVSTDPAHSTSDIFEHPFAATEQLVLPNLWGMEVDAEREAAEYVNQVREQIGRIFSPGVARQASRQLDLAMAMPGLAEVALLERMIDLITARGEVYDLIVFDTAPTGHTLQLLRMPEAMSVWTRALVKHRTAINELDHGTGNPEPPPPDPILDALERRRRRVEALRQRLLDRQTTSFVLVLIAERLAIEETARAEALLAEAGIDIGGVIVNRVLPEGLAGEFYQARWRQERLYLDEIERRFRRRHPRRIPQLASDVHGLAHLEEIAAYLGL